MQNPNRVLQTKAEITITKRLKNVLCHAIHNFKVGEIVLDEQVFSDQIK